MSSLVLRSVLALLLLATAASKIWRPHAPEPDLRAAVVALLSHRGWSAHEEAADPTDPLGNRVSFQAPGCDGRGRVFLVDLGMQLSPLLDLTVLPNYSRRFVYLDRSWLIPDRIGMRLEWLKSKAMSIFGLGQYQPTETALVVTGPRGCHAINQINLSSVWEKRVR